jgi:hypothetical protein
LDEHTSFVHVLLSVVHASPVAAGYEHRFAEQLFIVQGLLSSHCKEEEQQPGIGVLVQAPPKQISLVHTLSSLHWAAEVQQPDIELCIHVPLEEQTSFVHALLSLAHASPVAAG